jgi:hypothetical protein
MSPPSPLGATTEDAGPSYRRHIGADKGRCLRVQWCTPAGTKTGGGLPRLRNTSSSAPARSRPGPSRSGLRAARRSCWHATRRAGPSVRHRSVFLPLWWRRGKRAADDAEDALMMTLRKRGRRPGRGASGRPGNRRRAGGVPGPPLGRQPAPRRRHAGASVCGRFPSMETRRRPSQGGSGNEPSTTRTSLAGSATSATRAPSMIERESRPVARPPRINRARLTQKFPLGYALVYLAPGLTSYRV